jgi:hypothetical protein
MEAEGDGHVVCPLHIVEDDQCGTELRQGLVGGLENTDRFDEIRARVIAAEERFEAGTFFRCAGEAAEEIGGSGKRDLLFWLEADDAQEPGPVYFLQGLAE